MGKRGKLVLRLLFKTISAIRADPLNVLLRAAFPKLRVAIHWWVVDKILVGRESHSKFRLMHALSSNNLNEN